jgi:hypothetical protein
LVAVTVKAYDVPFVSPVTIIGLAVPEAVIFPGLDIMVYPVMGLPPFDGAVKLTIAWAVPATAVTPVGAAGAPNGITAVDGDDDWLDPMKLIAVTVKVYAMPLVSPVTVIGPAVPVALMLPGLVVTVYPEMVLPPLLVGGVKLTVA